MSQESSVKKYRKHVIQSLDDALESLSEAHLTCHEKLYPTWQTVDQDIQMLLRSVQALAIDLKRRDSDTAVLKYPPVEPEEPVSQPPELEDVKPEKVVPRSSAKKLAKSDKPAPPKKRKTKKKIQAAEPIPKISEIEEAEPLEEEIQGCPWCDSLQCEEVGNPTANAEGAVEKVLVCLECGQTYTASTKQGNI